jgi:hypothetical protein
MEAQTMEAWKFLRDDNRSGHGTESAWSVGEIRTHKGKVDLCRSGYHASLKPHQALEYAQGGKLARVRLSGEIERGEDKVCAETCEILEIRDVTNVLHEFACCVAETALGMAGVEDERSWNAIEAKRAWLRGEISLDDLSAARAAWSAADSTAWSAADSTAWSAADSTAWSAARAAAESAAGVAWSAARAAAESAAGVAWSAADSTAWSAARAAAWSLFDLLIAEEFGLKVE